MTTRSLDLLRNVDVRLSVELGRTQVKLKDVLALGPDSVVPLDRMTDELLDVYVNGQWVGSNTGGYNGFSFDVTEALTGGADAALKRVGLDVLGTVTPFNDETFAVDRNEITPTDREYEALVEDIGEFGFTRGNKARLERLYSQMRALARQNPDSRYRQTQAKIIVDAGGKPVSASTHSTPSSNRCCMSLSDSPLSKSAS